MRILAVVLMVVANVNAGPQEDAAAALALAKAKLDLPVTELSFTEAKAEAAKTNKPLMVRVGKMDCTGLCEAIKDFAICVHLEDCREIGVCGKPLFRAMVYSPDGYWYYHDWEKLPTKEEVEQKVKDLQSWVREAKRMPTALDWQI